MVQCESWDLGDGRFTCWMVMVFTLLGSMAMAWCLSDSLNPVDRSWW